MIFIRYNLISTLGSNKDLHVHGMNVATILAAFLAQVGIPTKTNKLSAAQILELSFNASAAPHSGVITKLCTFDTIFWFNFGEF